MARNLDEYNTLEDKLFSRISCPHSDANGNNSTESSFSESKNRIITNE